MHKDERKALLGASAPFYQEMGHLISDWAMLEHQVNESVWELAQTYPALGACITSQIFSINNRLMALIALMTVRKVDPKLIAQVRRFFRRDSRPS